MTTNAKARVRLYDLHPVLGDFREEMLRGFTESPKRLTSPMFLYDQRGSQLFEDITATQDYYLTDAELAAMDRHIDAIVEAIGPDCLLIELGSGASIKIRKILDRLDSPRAYVPIDISRDFLMASARKLAADHPDLQILPVCADFTQPIDLPDFDGDNDAHRVIYFPGSTLGNLSPEGAMSLMKRMARMARPGGGFLVGVDLKKDRATLERAYNDSEGVTEQFNLNLLRRMNRELKADFNLDQFRFEAVYNEKMGRIDSALISLADQDVTIDGQAIHIAKDERIHTEYSHKFSVEEFAKKADQAGFDVQHVWTDEDGLFSIQYLVAR
jgi:dimethylhistidine N-methyltransferase